MLLWPEEHVEIAARRSGFTPNKITLTKNRPVTIVLKAMDVPHGLLVSGMNISMQAKPGDIATRKMVPHNNRIFWGACTVNLRHDFMNLEIKVVDAVTQEGTGGQSVCAAPYEARKFGVRSAIQAVRAGRLCPG